MREAKSAAKTMVGDSRVAVASATALNLCIITALLYAFMLLNASRKITTPYILPLD
jgi:hypothetical protein